MLPVILFVLFLLFPTTAYAASDYIGTCEDQKKIKADPEGWKFSQPEFLDVPPLPPAFYDPYLNNNYPKNIHLNTSLFPNPDNLACLIEYAAIQWHTLYGTKFNNQYVEKVIEFAINNNYNPSLLLSLWAEETHGGDRSAIEFGCGQAYGFDNQLKCLSKIEAKYKLNSFACFMGSYAGDTPLSLNCGYGDPDGIITNPLFIYFITYYKYLTRDVVPKPIQSPPLSPTNFTTHPLRPFPKEVQETDKQTVFCAMRPLPVGQARIDMRVEYSGQPVVDVFTVGNLTQDFTEFIAPLMSITNPKKSDYALPFNDKAQRYLLDFLEGRAYYEPEPEPANPTVEESWDLFNRMGVFRKLAPKTYQDELKRAIIQRAGGSFSAADNPYGFEPASAEINNYTVGSWQGQTVTLKDYVGNWAPLPKDVSGNPNLHQIAYAAWLAKDGGKWSALWPYVPMFTREDTKGEILVINSNSPPNPPPEYPGTGFIEENLTDGTKSEVRHDVAHPHLARAYEVTTSLSFLLTPQQVHDSNQSAELADSWIPNQWGNNSTWLDPSYKQPPFTKYGVELGAHCDPNPELITSISSSGDFAYDDKFVTNVKRVDIGLTHAMINGPESVKGSAHPDDKKNCGAQYDCEKCIFDYTDPITGKDYYHLDDSGCFYYKQIRSNPNYLITYTPFLSEIVTSLLGSPRAIFDLFKPAGLDKQPYEEYDWPGIGNPGEDPPEYDYTPTAYTPPHKKVTEEKGWAEAGVRKPDDSQSYFYRYLGSIQCAKERVMMVLQPFISGSPYEPFAYNCFPEMSPPPSYIPPGVTPADEPDQPGGAPTPILTGLAGVCPNGGEKITSQLAAKMTGGTIRLLPNSTGPRKHQYRVCIKPTKIIIHWSGGWDNASGNDATYQTLVARDLACQLATDTDDTYLMQPFYENEVEMSWCARPWNIYSINNEVAGGYLSEDGTVDIRFTDRNGNPPRVGDPSRPGVKVFPESENQIIMAVDSICEVMKQYNIPWQQIYGHYHVPGSGKEDPGREFLENVFIPRVKNQCG